MNILLWILQGLLAFWNITGGLYTAFNYDNLTSSMAGSLPKTVWVAIGVLQALFALGLLWPKLTPVAAVYLAINSLAGLALFAKYSGFPGMLWGVVPAILAGFVAYGRHQP